MNGNGSEPFKITTQIPTDTPVQKELPPDFVCPIKANEDRVIVHEIPPESMSKGGLWVPDSRDRQLSLGQVMAVGPNVQYIELGWKVIFPRAAGYEFTYEEVDYKVIRANDISAWE